MLACDAHDTSSELIKMRSDVIFGRQKRTLGGPFGLQSALLFIFLKISLNVKEMPEASG